MNYPETSQGSVLLAFAYALLSLIPLFGVYGLAVLANKYLSVDALDAFMYIAVPLLFVSFVRIHYHGLKERA